MWYIIGAQSIVIGLRQQYLTYGTHIIFGWCFGGEVRFVFLIGGLDGPGSFVFVFYIGGPAPQTLREGVHFPRDQHRIALSVVSLYLIP